MKNITQKGIALAIGIDSVDPTHYNGWDGKLTICEKDAKDVKKTIAEGEGYETEILLTTEATRDNVIKSIKNAAKELKSGDIFFIYYSGHGGQIDDLNADEEDEKDETWCLYDGQLIDDELYTLFGKFEKGVRIIALSDSCHSGTVIKAANTAQTKFMPANVAEATYKANKGFYDAIMKLIFGKPEEKIKASVKLISACQDNQSASVGPVNSVFTKALFDTWDEGNFEGNYSEFHEEIKDASPSSQTPNLMEVGLQDAIFNRQKPFEI